MTDDGRSRLIAAALIATAGALGLGVRLAPPTRVAAQPAREDKGSDDPTRAADSSDEEAAAERDAADAARRGQLVARIGDERVTVGDLEDRIASLSPALRAQLTDPGQLSDYVVGVARFVLLSREAAKRGYGDDPDVRRAYDEALVQELLRRDFDERFPADDVPMAEARTYFEAHPDEFGRPELRRASHILVATREEAERLLEAAKTMDGNGFRALAREHSLDDATKIRGGDLRFFAEDGGFPGAAEPIVAPALAEAAFAVDAVDAVYPRPIPVADRFSVLRLTGIRVAEGRSFDQVAGAIRLRLARKKRNDAVDELRRSLRGRAEIEVDDEALRGFTLDVPEPPAPSRPPTASPRSPFAPRRGPGQGAPSP